MMMARRAAVWAVVITLSLAGGVLIGLAIGRNAGSETDEPRIPMEGCSPPGHAPHAATTQEQPTLVGRQPVSPARPGEAVLAIGDGLHFASSRVEPGAARPDSDVVCLDLRDQVAVLACRAGGAIGEVISLDKDRRLSAAEEFHLMDSAPKKLGASSVVLRAGGPPHTDTPTLRPSRVVFVRAMDGQAYKVLATAFTSSQHALERRVSIRFEEVPARDGGGVLGPNGEAVPLDSWPGSSRLERLLHVPEPVAVEAQWSLKGLPASFVVLRDLPPQVELTVDDASLLIPATLESELDIRARGVLLVLEGGLGTRGKIHARDRIGLVVMGDLWGEAKADRGSVIHITGDLAGTLRAYGTVIVDGDVTGTLDLRGLSNALVRGRVLRFPENLAGRGINKIFLQSKVYLDQLEIPPPHTGMRSLYLSESDLPDGDHGPIKGWSRVVVGGEVWRSLRRD